MADELLEAQNKFVGLLGADKAIGDHEQRIRVLEAELNKLKQLALKGKEKK